MLSDRVDALSEQVEQWREADRELAATWREADQKALAHQAAEYERRLGELNHAHREALRVQATYVDRETLRLELADIHRQTSALAEAIRLADIAHVRLVEQVSSLASKVEALANSQVWITRLVVGSVVVALLALLTGLAGRLPI